MKNLANSNNRVYTVEQSFIINLQKIIFCI